MTQFRTLTNKIKFLLIGVQYSFKKRSPAPNHYAILAAARFGSIGDLAMIEGLYRILSSKGTPTVHLATYSRQDVWEASFEFSDQTPIPRSYSEFLLWRNIFANQEHVYLNGADVLDGKYSIKDTLARLRFIKFAALACNHCTITGFSFNANVPKQIVDAFKGLPPNVTCCLRDPKSKERFDALTGRQSRQVADLAFMVQPDTLDVSSLSYSAILQAKEKGQTIVGITPNLHSVTSDHSEAQKAVIAKDQMLETVRSLHAERPDLFFILLPHDIRSGLSDATICEKMMPDLESRNIAYHYVNEPLTPSFIKGIVGHVGLLITGRMHCGIAALGQGTPVVFIDYQDKVKGLESFFGISASTYANDDIPASAARITTLAKQSLGNLSEIKKQIESRLPAVLKLSEANMTAP